MDEIEVDFKDYDFHEDFQNENEKSDGGNIKTDSNNIKPETDSNVKQKHLETNINAIGSPLSLPSNVRSVPSLTSPIGYSSADTPDETLNDKHSNGKEENHKG